MMVFGLEGGDADDMNVFMYLCGWLFLRIRSVDIVVVGIERHQDQQMFVSSPAYFTLQMLVFLCQFIL